MSTQQAQDQGWFKSSYSGAGGGNCVEVAGRQDAVLVRDSKDVSRPHLTATPAAWSTFLDFTTQH